MKKIKRVLSIFLITIMISISVSTAYCQPVRAESVIAEGLFIALRGVMYQFGILLGDEFFNNAISSEILTSGLVDLKNSGAIKENSNGTFTFSAEAMEQLSDLLDEYFAQETNLPDVVWIPVIPSDEFSASHFYSTEQYYMFRSYADNKGLTYVCAYPKTDYFKVYDFSNYTFFMFTADTTSTRSQFLSKIKSANILCSDLYASNNETWSVLVASSGGVDLDHQSIIGSVYDASGLVSDDLTRQQLSYNWDYSFELYIYPRSNGGLPTRYWSRSCTDSQGFFVCPSSMDAHYIPIFFSVASIKKFATGQSDYYRVTPTYDGGDVTINPNADYSKVYNNITTTIQNNYADGKNYSDILAAIQLAYAESMKEISAGLDDIGDNTEESNSWLEKIYNQVTDIDEILKEQFDSMISTITDGFNSVIDALHIITIPTDDDSGGDSGGESGTEKKSFWTRLGEFCSSLINGILSLIETIFMKALDGLLYLSNIVVDNASLAFDGLTERFERLSALFGGESLFGNLRDAIPEEVQDILVMFMFGIVASGVVLAIKR